MTSLDPSLDLVPHAADVGTLTSRACLCPQKSTDLMRQDPLVALRLLLALALAVAPASRVGAQEFHIERLRTEYATNPIGIDESAPRMSWMLQATRRGTRQSA